MQFEDELGIPWGPKHSDNRLITVGDTIAVAAANVHEPAANTAAVITYAAGGGGVSHVISGVAWSYDAVPTAGSLTIEDGLGTTIFVVSITAAGAGFFMFAPRLLGTAATALVVTLAAGGAAVTGKVSVMGHWTA